MSTEKAFFNVNLEIFSFVLGCVWFNFLKLGFFKKWGFQKVQYETGLFYKVECFVKTIKKCFVKKLSIWLALIKVAV